MPELKGRNNALSAKLKDTFPNWRDAHDDARCQDAAEWVIRSLYHPTGPSAVPLPDPEGTGGELLAALCKRFGV